MNTLGLVLVIIFALGAFGLLGYTIYKNILVIKKKKEITDIKAFLKKEGIFALISAVSFTIMLSFCYMLFKISPKGSEVTFTIIFGFLTGLSGFLFINVFILHYYGLDFKDQFPKVDKALFKILICSIPVFLISLLYMTNGFAEYWKYPIPNLLSFKNGFVYSGDGGENGLAGIAFYALTFVGGAIFVYFLIDHKYYQQYGKHGIMESTFLFAFPMGILAGRLGYVVGNFDIDFAHRFKAGEWWSMFAIWEGGLTILAGAIGGIVAGIVWFLWRRKQYSVWLAMDIVIPCILIAQAIGRWGNFFNCEVHGMPTSIDNYAWLPTFIVKNGRFSSTAATLEVGQMYTPLFFIEALVNLAGYFILADFFGKLLRKHTELGDLGFGYIIWYGLTRTFMEPLRYSAFNMGNNGYWSWLWAMVFVLVGTLCIVANHLVRYIYRKTHGTYKVDSSAFLKGIITSSAILVASLVLILIGAINMSKSSFATKIAFSQYNVGLICLILGISLITTLFISVPILIEGIKNRKNAKV